MSKRNKNRQPLWRPNFVDESALPDIKVIRTDFVINFIAIALMLGVGFLFAKQEYHVSGLRGAIADLQDRVDSGNPSDKAKLELSASFVSQAKYLVEVEKFFASPFLPHEFLFELSEAKPADLIFKSVSIREVSVENASGYNVDIIGDARSLTTLDDFKGVLERADLLEIDGYSVDIDEALEARDQKTGIFPYRLSIILRPVKKVGGSK